MIELETDDRIRAKARAEAKEMGPLFGSFTKGGGNSLGMVGEIVVNKALKGERVGHKIFAYDIVLKDGTTIDVKTQRGRVRPLPHYNARIYASEKDKEKIGSKCDVYYFVRCSENLKQVWILGSISAKEFIKIAEFNPKGSVDPNDGKLSYSDEYVIPIAALTPPPESFEVMGRRVELVA